MSERDVHPDDMFHDDPLLEAFAREVREATDHAPLPVVGATLAAVLEGRAPALSYPEVEPPAPARRVAGGWSPLRLRLGLGLVGAAAAVLALAAAGSLPDPAQRQAARLASVVGLQLPKGDDDGGQPVETTTTTSTTSTTVPTTMTTTATTTAPASLPGSDLPDAAANDSPPSTVPPARPTTSTTEDRPGRDGGRGRDEDEDADEDKGEDEDEDDNRGPGNGDEDDDGDRSGPGSGDEREKDERP